MSGSVGTGDRLHPFEVELALTFYLSKLATHDIGDALSKVVVMVHRGTSMVLHIIIHIYIYIQSFCARQVLCFHIPRISFRFVYVGYGEITDLVKRTHFVSNGICAHEGANIF